jgi:conjugal transfer pilus assembly protein TraF
VTPQTPAILVYQNPTIDPKTGAQRQLTVRGSSGRDIRLRPCLKPQGCLTYVGAGVMAVDDIAERLYVLLATNPGEDF